jgi:hypothetical protein
MISISSVMILCISCFFCLIRLYNISSSNLNRAADSCSSLMVTSLATYHIHKIIRFKAPKRDGDREEKGKRKLKRNTDISTQLKDRLQPTMLVLIYEQFFSFVFWKE